MGHLLRRWDDHQMLLQGESCDFRLPVRTPSPFLDSRVLALSGRLLTLHSHRWTSIPGQSSNAVQEHHPRDRLVVEPSAVRLLSDRPPSDLAVLHGHAQLPRGGLSEGEQPQADRDLLGKRPRRALTASAWLLTCRPRIICSGHSQIVTTKQHGTFSTYCTSPLRLSRRSRRCPSIRD